MAQHVTSTPLHLLGSFEDPYVGGDRELPDLAQVLGGRRDCVLWTGNTPHPVYAARGVRRIRPGTQDAPQGGMLLIGGVHVALGDWLRSARLERIALRYNLPQHERLFHMVGHIRDVSGLEPEILFASDALKLSVGLSGVFEPSLIPLDDFLELPVERPPGRPFTVGRVSRDVLEKHHPDDLMLYRMLAAQGVNVRVMGGTCLAPWLTGVPGIELLPTGSMPVADFNAGLDLFVYRTGTFHEPYGRVVFEAMACGLPVVVTSAGGFSEQVQSGVNGCLFDTQEQAYDAVMALKGDPLARLAMGAAARETAVRLHGDAAIEKLAQFYLR